MNFHNDFRGKGRDAVDFIRSSYKGCSNFTKI